MGEFNSLSDVYDYLEERAIDYRDAYQIGVLFRQVRDRMQELGNERDEKTAQWEADFFNFILEPGGFYPTFSGTNEKGEVVEYPSVGRFNNETYDYLERRLNDTSNPVLKARYSHLLWLSPRKHQRFAKTAVDSYLKLVLLYEKKDSKSPSEHYGLDVMKSMEIAYGLACQIGYRTNDVAEEIKRLIKGFSYESSSFFALRVNLIKLMLKDKKIFSQTDLSGIEEICWDVSERLLKANNPHASIDMLRLGSKIDQKLQRQSHHWDRKIAEDYEVLMYDAEKNQNPACIKFCQDALDMYRRIKDKNKVEELERKYIDLKKSIKLTEIKKEIDKEHIEKCQEVARQIIQRDAEDIIKTLMLGKALLPRYQDMNRIAEDHEKKFIHMHLAPIQVFDQDGNIAQHFETPEEKRDYGILWQYQISLEVDKLSLINHIFYEGIRSGKLDTEVFLEFFRKHSWFGEDLSKPSPNGKTITYNWLNLLAPSLHHYFVQMEYYFNNLISQPNLVPCIDSLTLKIEGLFRDICRYSDVATSFSTRDTQGRTVVREKDIHSLLYEDTIKSMFDEDDLLFFKFLLVEKAGYNLRHKVAHSLIYFEEYNISFMNLLIMVLLKLAKYDFVREKEKRGRFYF